ncbi:MAG: 2,3-bisphosphoglycerate-independent phosphoglycerate mutase [Phycisphaerae bacterium]|jgi:2,3-bisphosphoglycerate-independent phosphoglycerate mutase|nr:2,3-bisphosphoglycerate-independent phosphoglycerate mutase [Phycisphaerae bacterium]
MTALQDTYGNLIASLAIENDKRIVLLVMDGIGDCDNDGNGTALQIAKTPNFDALAAQSALGLSLPIAVGVTPGSGPGHLGLFGYDPLVYQVGRGVLSALGIEFDVTPRDVCARLNFCTIDADSNVTDRRAGRIGNDENARILGKIRPRLLPPAGVEVFLETVAEHRALMVLRGDGLDDDIGQTDPQAIGAAPLLPTRPPHDGSKTAKIVEEILNQVRRILADEPRANMILARGFAKFPDWPTFAQRYRLTPAAVAGYPMYRGVARLVGIPMVAQPTTAADVCAEAGKALAGHTFVFAHFKYTDKTGEDGDLDAKVARIEEMDAAIPTLLEADPDVLIVTGDHSTPPSLRLHSWHPVPVLMKGPYLRGGDGPTFDEAACRSGQIGTILAKELIPLAMAHAGKLEKFGA